MFESIKNVAKRIITSRLFVLALLMILLFGVLLQRVFTLQIVNGKEYADKYTLMLEKERTTNGTRGIIYDRNGIPLAYNELSYTVTLEDSGHYSNDKSKNAKLNAEIYEILTILEGNGDELYNSFALQMAADGTLSFNVEGTNLKRFLADVYGYSKIEDMSKNTNKLGYSEAEATPQQVFEYLRSDNKFGIRLEGVDTPTKDDEKYGQLFFSMEDAYKILTVRYSLGQNAYQKYIQTTVATDICQESVAAIKENSDHLEGVEISEDTIRRYADSVYFSHLIGYTGKISQEEYDELVKENEDYTLTDIVGKSGIEKEMETVLQGSKGHELFYKDNMGRIVEMRDYIEAESGNDVYLSIDHDLQIAVYKLLEQEIAGIVYSQIENIKEYDGGSASSDILIPIDDVYYALFNNNIIDYEAFSLPGASPVEQAIYQQFEQKLADVTSQIMAQMNAAAPISYGDLEEEQQFYMSYIRSMLSENQVLVDASIDTEDEVYKDWKNDRTSLAEYLRHAISEEWIDITQFETDSKYSDSLEIYDALLNYIQEELQTDRNFHKRLYKYMIREELISGSQICQVLFDQEILARDDETYQGLANGTVDDYTFMREKIKNLEITPAQLALDPCTGSCVIIDSRSGDLLACVSYPGYDTNRLANNMDNDYFNSLRVDLTSPMYSNATQQRTAPGSTFKPVVAVAALTEGIIDTTTLIEDKGKFELVQDGPTCWIYPTGSTHGQINVSEAIRDSCNYFFYTLGYNMSLVGDTYQESKGLETLTKYAKLFGLGDNTGIEVPENEPKISDEFPITTAIGQANNDYTTSELARYVTAIANRGTVYRLTLLDKVTDSSGKVIQDYGPKVDHTMDTIAPSTWDAIHEGMRMVVENSSTLRGLSEQLPAAGKTGTAQQVANRPNHALFIGYAPYDQPEIALATRIAYGYTSANAARVSRSVFEYYFHLKDESELLTGQAQEVGQNANSFTD